MIVVPCALLLVSCTLCLISCTLSLVPSFIFPSHPAVRSQISEVNLLVCHYSRWRHNLIDKEHIPYILNLLASTATPLSSPLSHLLAEIRRALRVCMNYRIHYRQ